VSINIRTSLGVAVLLAGLAVAHPAAATTIIDFQSAVWSGANGQASFALGPVTLSATGGNLSQFAIGGLGVFDANAVPPDPDSDEINNIQQITITFAGGTSIDQFTVLKLFREGPVGAEYNEVGAYSLDGGTTFNSFTAPNGNLPSPITNGDFTVNVGTFVNSIIFQIGNPDPSDTKNDFSVKSLRVTGGQVDTHDLDAVPEPATLVLLGSGLIVFARLRRRTR
jgi:PEP-CTERM motif